ncbi:MAG: hypothetical protein GX138_02575 [Firmicutes bacterium]|nr:hypothetical protein [Bacillota bacterium]
MKIKKGDFMEFHEKLNFLLDITKTSNSVLARHIIVDPSYVSRLRSGKRKPPKNDYIIEHMCAFFARNMNEKYQLHALAEAMGIRAGLHNVEDLPEIIKLWLTSEKDEQIIIAPKFIRPEISFSSQESHGFGQGIGDFPDLASHTSIFYGIEGKRQAVLYTLNRMLTLEPQTMLLFSDEETTWMTGDLEFAKMWAHLMFEIINKGHNIVIIHTISRHLDEMLNAIGQWMPLYLTGSIKPYYYPKTRDGLFKRTLFITPGSLAMVSGSVGDATSYGANLIIEEPKAVAAYEEEFHLLLNQCQPLMLIYTEDDKDRAMRTLTEFEEELTNTIKKTEALSLLTMSDQLLEKTLANTDFFDEYIELHKRRKENFEVALKHKQFTEIIKLPSIDDIVKGKVNIALSFVMAGGEISYTPALFYEHLKYVVELLKKEENYQVSLVESTVDERYMVYLKENRGVVVAKTSQPPVLLAMNESNMVASFWSFLQSIVNKRLADSKESTIELLEDYLEKLKKHI